MTDDQSPPPAAPAPLTGVIAPPDEADLLRMAISDWWMDRAREEVDAVAPKAVEYGATDLAEIGRTMSLVMGNDEPSHADATELGIYFYAIGKMARWTDAIKTGRRVSDDTIHDLLVYIRMVQRTRDVGGWPFNPDDAAEGGTQ